MKKPKSVQNTRTAQLTAAQLSRATGGDAQALHNNPIYSANGTTGTNPLYKV